jgi:hypothetical protein
MTLTVRIRITFSTFDPHLTRLYTAWLLELCTSLRCIVYRAELLDPVQVLE